MRYIGKVKALKSKFAFFGSLFFNYFVKIRNISKRTFSIKVTFVFLPNFLKILKIWKNWRMVRDFLEKIRLKSNRLFNLTKNDFKKEISNSSYLKMIFLHQFFYIHFFTPIFYIKMFAFLHQFLFDVKSWCKTVNPYFNQPCALLQICSHPPFWSKHSFISSQALLSSARRNPGRQEHS